jgi:CubicO group peptidase (beta-lactamase class C family)
VLDEAQRSGAFQAGQCCVISRGSVVGSSAHGVDHLGQRLSSTSLFDVASVTKMAATTLATAALIARGELGLETRVSQILPRFTGGSKADVTVRELLAHGSGLPAWEPYFMRCLSEESARSIYPGWDRRERDFVASRELIVDALMMTDLTDRRGQRVYSDLGFMVLGLILEAVSGQRLARLCRELVFEPLGLARTGFFELDRSDPEPWCPAGAQIVPTGLTRPREPAPGQEALYSVHDQPRLVATGEVDDDNAFAMGGVAGHAGLFSTAEELASLGWAIFEEIGGATRLGAGEVLRRFARPDLTTKGARRGLGFDIPAGEGSLAGSLLGQAGPLGGIGHLGFTGCSLWIDLDRELVIALLTNRVYPTRGNVEPLRVLRPAFHDEVIRALT